MTQEERYKKAMAFIDANKMYHVDVSYGPDCEIYKTPTEAVSVNIAKLAVEIALGKA